MNYTSSVVSIVLIGIIMVLVVLFILDFTKRNESDDHPTIRLVQENFGKINPKYGKIPIKEGTSAFTEDKSVITLCLVDPKSGYIYDMNTIMYVALHELAHVITVSKDHTQEFENNFAKLLNEGKKLGFYDPSRPMPESYCGVSSVH